MEKRNTISTEKDVTENELIKKYKVENLLINIWKIQN